MDLEKALLEDRKEERQQDYELRKQTNNMMRDMFNMFNTMSSQMSTLRANLDQAQPQPRPDTQ